MQRMNRLWRFLELPPSPAEIVLFNKLWLKPGREFSQRVRTAHPPAQPGAKTSPERRDAPMVKDVSSLGPRDGPESPLAEQVSQVGPSPARQAVGSAGPPQNESRLALSLSALS